MSTFFNDPIADILTRVRNAAMVGRTHVVSPHSKMREAIAAILADNNFLVGYKVTEVDGFKSLELTLPEDRSVITQLIRVSKPGRRVYIAAKDVPTVLGGRGLVILSTSGGMMTGRDARKRGLGGELICKVW